VTIVLTRKQERIWSKKMKSLERRLLGYYASNPNEEPDGSFCMGAFREGYWLRARKEAEARRA
jgi:hypothetical protein